MPATADLLGAVATVVGLAGVLAFVLAYVRGKHAADTIKLLRDEVDALGLRLRTVEQDLAAERGKVAELETVRKVLVDQVTGATAIAGLSAQLGEHIRWSQEIVRRIEVAAARAEPAGGGR